MKKEQVEKAVLEMVANGVNVKGYALDMLIEMQLAEMEERGEQVWKKDLQNGRIEYWENTALRIGARALHTGFWKFAE